MNEPTANIPAKRYFTISRLYAVVAVVTLGVASWSAAHIVPGQKTAAVSIAIDLVLGFVTTGCAVYFHVLARKSERLERGS